LQAIKTVIHRFIHSLWIKAGNPQAVEAVRPAWEYFGPCMEMDYAG
jgi:hypothetical protein